MTREDRLDLAKRIYAWPDTIADTDFSPDVAFDYGEMGLVTSRVECLLRYRRALVFACSDAAPTNWVFDMIDSKRAFVVDKAAFDREFGRVLYDLTSGEYRLVS